MRVPLPLHLFSNLTHYVRSGDFILALLRDAKDLNGYAFALGALAHYVADNDGYRNGTNYAVPDPRVLLKAASVLEVPPHTVFRSRTQVGDQLEIPRLKRAST